MQLKLIFVILFFRTSLLSSCLGSDSSIQSFVITHAAPATDLQPIITPSCPHTAHPEWLGADCSVSFPMSLVSNNTEYIWLFADTILGSCSAPPQSNRSIHHFIHGSIGLFSTSQPRSPVIEMNWIKYPNPLSPFSPANASNFYWFMAGAPLSNSSIIIAADTITDVQGGLGFKGLNSVLLIVSSPQSISPANWASQTTTVMIPFTGDDYGLSFCDGMTVDTTQGEEDPWLYFWGTLNSNSTVASRIRLSDASAVNFEGNNSSLQFWGIPSFSSSSAPAWIASPLTPALDPQNPSKVILAPIEGLTGQAELTVYHHPILGLWYTFGMDFLAFDIHLYTSPNITGPYIEYPDTVYTIPNEDHNSQMFCYAMKAHPELEGLGTVATPQKGQGEIIFTYVCNSFQFLQQITEYPTLYVPQMVRLNFTVL